MYRNLVLKHVFFNSNKRTAFTCMEIFLFLNGVKIKIPTVEGIEFTVRIATEKLDEADIANWIEKFIVKS
ncbi:type II toxin-antitoxin system death-on-curing family toxin [Aliicoccus persicus]|uniref:type II toxin-antitoxin system death-on-curing family toxin n=1 Tax=Aliicoccus persicus TaxID=930138 RepID=UPI000B89FE3C